MYKITDLRKTEKY